MAAAYRHLYRTILLTTLLALVVALLPASAHAAQATFGITQACPAGTTPSSGFTDATGTHAPGIDCLALYGLTQGKTATLFGTTDQITRGQAASLLMRMYDAVDGVAAVTAVADAFSDAGTTHRTNIERLAGFDPPIVRGFDDGTFRPDDNITRAQFAAFSARMLDAIAAQLDDLDALPAAGASAFTDVSGGTHADSIERLAAAGILLGTGGTLFEPGNVIIRGQSATVLARLLGGLVDSGGVAGPAVVGGVAHDATNVQPGALGSGLANATLTLQAAGQPPLTAQTNAQGVYSLSVPPGTYALSVTAAGFLPFQQTITVAATNLTRNFGLYKTAVVPASGVVPTTTAPGDVTVQGGFWVMELYRGQAPGRVAFNAKDATEIILARPDGVVITIGAAGTDDAWWSRNTGGTSDRVGDQAGVHRAYYRVSGTWYELTATFNASGRLIAVNGVDYADPSA